VRGLDPPEVTDEEVSLTTLAVWAAAGPVVGTGEDDQLEVLVRLDEGVNLAGKSQAVDNSEIFSRRCAENRMFC
jgi:hypothetical protein